MKLPFIIADNPSKPILVKIGDDSPIESEVLQTLVLKTLYDSKCFIESMKSCIESMRSCIDSSSSSMDLFDSTYSSMDLFDSTYSSMALFDSRYSSMDLDFCRSDTMVPETESMWAPEASGWMSKAETVVQTAVEVEKEVEVETAAQTAVKGEEMLRLLLPAYFTL